MRKIVRRMKYFVLLTLGVFLFNASRCPWSPGSCNSIPAEDNIAPVAHLSIEYWPHKNWPPDTPSQETVQDITADSTVQLQPFALHTAINYFNIIGSGSDNVGIKYLWIEFEYTYWTGAIAHKVQPLIAPTDFGSQACTPRSASTRFTWDGNPTSYKIWCVVEDYHHNRNSSPMLTVVYGTPPQPLAVGS